MKNALLVSFILIGSVLGFSIAHSSTVTTNIDRINVDFNRKVATISLSQKSCEDNGDCIPFGSTTQTVITNQAFDATVSTLEQMNALNLNAVMNVLKN